MPDTAIKFDPETDELFDRDGTPVRVGDWIIDEKGKEWQVEGLRPRQEPPESSLDRTPTGLLDTAHSGFALVNYKSREIVTFARGMNVYGTTQTGASIPNVKRLDLTPAEVRQRDLARIEQALGNLDEIEGVLASRRREIEREYEILKAKPIDREES